MQLKRWSNNQIEKTPKKLLLDLKIGEYVLVSRRQRLVEKEHTGMNLHVTVYLNHFVRFGVRQRFPQIWRLDLWALSWIRDQTIAATVYQMKLYMRQFTLSGLRLLMSSWPRPTVVFKVTKTYLKDGTSARTRKTKIRARTDSTGMSLPVSARQQWNAELDVQKASSYRQLKCASACQKTKSDLSTLTGRQEKLS